MISVTLHLTTKCRLRTQVTQIRQVPNALTIGSQQILAAVHIFKSPPPLPPAQNGRHVADDIFKNIFVNKNVRISIGISLTFVPSGPIDNKCALVRIMACRLFGANESMLTQFIDTYMWH